MHIAVPHISPNRNASGKKAMKSGGGISMPIAQKSLNTGGTMVY